ncbi:MAG: hypothetical protein ACRD2A_20185, partial [Vicinamibacterales bacterium]
MPLPPPSQEIRWFQPWGSVTEYEDGRCEIHLGGTLLGWFDRDGKDRSMRNLLLVTLAAVPKMRLERLANAFGITDRYLWELRQKATTGGPGAVLLSRMGGKSTVSEQKRRQLRKWFAEDLTPTEAFRRQGRGKKLSRATISRERAKWLEEQTGAAVASAVAKLPTEEATAATSQAANAAGVDSPQLEINATAVPTNAEAVEPDDATITSTIEAAAGAGAVAAIETTANKNEKVTIDVVFDNVDVASGNTDDAADAGGDTAVTEVDA